MKKLQIHSAIYECQMDELSPEEQQLVDKAIVSTNHSYAPYSDFHVGAALLLDDGTMLPGCNQETVVPEKFTPSSISGSGMNR